MLQGFHHCKRVLLGEALYVLETNLTLEVSMISKLHF